MLLIPALTGCTSRDCFTYLACMAPATPLVLPSDQAVVPAIVPDLSELGNGESPEIEIAQPYNPLGEFEVQCLAASRSASANLFADEATAVVQQSRGRHARSAQLLSDVLMLYAAQERNQSAGDALEAFLRLAEAESGNIKLDGTLAELDEMLQDIERVQQQGMASPVSHHQVEERRFDLLRRKHEMVVSIAQLNCTLGQLLGVSHNTASHIWPDVDLKVTVNTVDVDDAIAIALATRADYMAARYAACMLDEETLPAARCALGIAQTGLGLDVGAESLLARWGSSDNEAAARAGQLHRMSLSLEQQIAQDVRLAVTMLEQRLHQVRHSGTRLEALDSHLQLLHQQRTVGQATPFEMHETRIDIISAEQDLLHDVIEWKIAVAKLKQAQGLLAQECACSTGHCPDKLDDGDPQSLLAVEQGFE